MGEKRRRNLEDEHFRSWEIEKEQGKGQDGASQKKKESRTIFQNSTREGHKR